MTESAKPLYELRPRGKHYQGLWQGKHCLAAICVKKQRGVRDARFLLRAANCHDKLVTACEEAQTAIYDAMHAGNLSRSYCGGVTDKLEAAIKKAKGE